MKALMVAMVAAVAVSPLMAMAEDAQTIPASGRVWLEGNSTLHKYGADAKSASVRLQVASEGAANVSAAVRDGKMSGLSVAIPVAKLSSGEKGLDENMVKTLKGEQNPTIRFTMKSYRAVPNGSGFKLEAQGALQVAGVEKNVTVTADANEVASGLHLVGSVPLLMTDYGIKPPVMMLGTIKTDNLVTVKFDLTVKSVAPAPNAG